MHLGHFDSRRLHTFHVVAEEGTVTAAAKRLAVSQPAVSQQIQQLEEAVGTPLFIRESRGVRLTPAGQSLLAHARAIDAALADAFSEVARHQASQSLRIGASTTVANHLLPALLAEFCASESDGPVEVLVGNTDRMVDAVATGQVSVAIVEGIPASIQLDTVEIPGDALMPLVRSDRPWTFQDVQLGHVRLLWREGGSGTRAVVEKALRREVGRVFQPSDHVFGSGESLYAAVCAGLGVGFVSELIGAPGLEAGLVRTLTDVAFEVKRPFSWVLPSRGLSGRERIFFDWYERRRRTRAPRG